jgi:hypothetical protein
MLTGSCDAQQTPALCSAVVPYHVHQKGSQIILDQQFVPTTPPCITPHTPSRLSTKYCLLVFTRQGSTLTAAAVHCPDPQHTLQHANCQHIVQVYRTHSHQGACRQKHWPNRTHPYPTQRSVVAAMQVCCRQLLYTVNNSMEPLTLCPTTNLGSRQLTLCPCTKPVHRRQHEPATAARTASSLDDERVDAPQPATIQVNKQPITLVQPYAQALCHVLFVEPLVDVDSSGVMLLCAYPSAVPCW